MNNIKTLSVIVLVIAIFSCKKEDIMIYDSDDSGIYFQTGHYISVGSTTESYYDSLSYSFADAAYETMDTILNVRLRTLGNTKAYDRKVKISIDETSTTATEGIHYKVDLDTAIIKAEESELIYGIQILRTPDMLDSAYSIVLQVEDNEFFKVYFDEQSNTNALTTAPQIKANKIKIMVSEIYKLPWYWGYFGNEYFGTWSIEKYKLLNQTIGWTNADWNNAGRPPVLLGRFGVVALTLRNVLQKLADEGNPKREADGSLMQLGSNYQVDYSGIL